MFDHETFKYAHFVGRHRMPFCVQQPMIELKDLLQLAQCTFWKSSPRKKEFTVFQTDGWNLKKVFAEFSATDLYILVFQRKMEVICGMESRFHQADENWICKYFYNKYPFLKIDLTFENWRLEKFFLLGTQWRGILVGFFGSWIYFFLAFRLNFKTFPEISRWNSGVWRSLRWFVSMDLGKRFDDQKKRTYQTTDFCFCKIDSKKWPNSWVGE